VFRLNDKKTIEEIASKRMTTPERIASLLREKILAGQVAPGEPLREEELAKQYRVSRHIIREMLRLLAVEGVAEYVPFKGVRVTHVSKSSVSDIYGVRRYFEINAIDRLDDASVKRLAQIHGRFSRAVEAQSWDDAFMLDVAFHSTIVSAVGSPILGNWHRHLFKALSMAHLLTTEYREEGMRTSVAEHAAIVVALTAGNAADAAEALSLHLANAEMLLLRHIGSPSVSGKSENQDEVAIIF
jgi:DNA-binding GntR family transcriptional regulator